MICNNLKPSHFFTENVTGPSDPDKEQSMEMKSDAAAASDTVRPAQSVVSKKRGDYVSYDQCIQQENPRNQKAAKFLHKIIVKL